jgi:hypothetical protein
VHVTSAGTSTATTPANASIVLGSGNTDGVTVTGNAAGGSPTGSVDFFDCGPTATAQACTSQANAVGGATSLTPGAGNTSTATSVSFTPTATGYWCFAGYYSGDSNYGASSDATVSECFHVTSAGTVTATVPASAHIAFGSSNTDKATVTGNAAGGSPTGSVSFYECGPTASAVACTSQSNAVGSPVALTSGAAHTATATSPTFSPTGAGYWCFAGYYSGDGNYSASSDATTDECYEVAPTITSTSTTTFTEGVAGSFQVTGSGGTSRVSYTESGALPTGVTLSTSGLLSGTPGFVAGSFPITITSTSSGVTSTQSFTLFVSATSSLHITTTSLPAAHKGVAYATKLAAAGGNKPYRWTKTSGTLPKGLKLKSNGKIIGTPGQSAVTSMFTVKVMDGSHPRQSATATFTITVS